MHFYITLRFALPYFFPCFNINVEYYFIHLYLIFYNCEFYYLLLVFSNTNTAIKHANFILFY